MESKRKKICILVILLVIIGNVSFAAVSEFTVNDNVFVLNNRGRAMFVELGGNYSYTNASGNNAEINKYIEELTKKVTYLLLGEKNRETETSDMYYKRYKEYLSMRYSPSIPRDGNSESGVDESSQEYKDNKLSSTLVHETFRFLDEKEINYSRYGDINVTVGADGIAFSVITIPNVTVKQSNEEVIEAPRFNLNIYYCFKRLNGDYKILGVSAEFFEDIIEGMNSSEEEFGTLNIEENYISKLSKIYNFDMANAISDEVKAKIYQKNKTSIVYLSAMYNAGIVANANGFFVGNGLIATTYSFLDKALSDAQTIVISDSNWNIYKLEGITAVNESDDLAILKVNVYDNTYVDITDTSSLKREDGLVALNSRTGVGLNTTTGVVISGGDVFQTSFSMTEEMQGTPLFDSNGNFAGMLTNKGLNFGNSCGIGKNNIARLTSVAVNGITKTIPFEKLKQRFYSRYGEERVVNNIPKNKWEEFLECENVKNFIMFDLVKEAYRDDVISLRYKNNLADSISTMQMASGYTGYLKSKEYTENIVSDSKYIYKNGKFRIMVMAKFDYLIIVMAKL